jgi:hypothetical protein
MPVLSVIKVFKVFRTFFLKILTFILPFLKDFTVLPIHNVGISSLLLFKIAVLSRVLLLFSAKIII